MKVAGGKQEAGSQNLKAIELHIEELVLHGFERTDREAIGEAVRLELARLIGEGGEGLSTPGVQRDLYRADISVPNTADFIGVRLAQEIYDLISNPQVGGAL